MTDDTTKDDKAKDDKAKDEPTDDLVTTHHEITIDGRTLAYTVTAGRVVLRLEGHTDDKFDGAKVRAEVFMTAYTLDDAEARTRTSPAPPPPGPRPAHCVGGRRGR